MILIPTCCMISTSNEERRISYYCHSERQRVAQRVRFFAGAQNDWWMFAVACFDMIGLPWPG